MFPQFYALEDWRYPKQVPTNLPESMEHRCRASYITTPVKFTYTTVPSFHLTFMLPFEGCVFFFFFFLFSSYYLLCHLVFMYSRHTLPYLYPFRDRPNENVLKPLYNKTMGFGDKLTNAYKYTLLRIFFFSFFCFFIIPTQKYYEYQNFSLHFSLLI